MTPPGANPPADELRAPAGEEDRDRVLLLANPQGNPGNRAVSAFGLGARREQSEAFVNGFGAVHTLIARADREPDQHAGPAARVGRMPAPPHHHHQPLLPTSTATWARRRRFPRRQQQRAGWTCLLLSALLPALALLAWALGGSDAQAAGPSAERLDDAEASSVGPAGPAAAADRVVLEVVQGNATLGNVTIELATALAPLHAANFLALAGAGRYDNTTFHRVIDDFMIQGGDFDRGDGTGGHAGLWAGYCDGRAVQEAACPDEARWTLPDEADNGLLHTACAISMAKTAAPHTGGSQFFLVPEDVPRLPHLDRIHTVFGNVTAGCDVVTTVSETPTLPGDRPAEPVRIRSARPVLPAP